MHWYLRAWEKYTVFSGRASRTEYWFFVLANVVVFTLLIAVDTAVGTRLPDLLYGLAVIVPGLAAGSRRLHDTGRTGWWQLLLLIPVVGWIALAVLQALDGTHGPNAYGAEPRQTSVHGAARLV
ncbi:DUF805 domain-containing protein [Streptomyces sp. NBC_01190]|uniref:DUF805 domain-containing protein n=1 Tax=Streptomyces sp. NBC_01190 TaxID=2903767 RepID=UPI0038674344|nr:DUF805 domain-containing protein [Streptomyces sp. NBC_01190]